MSARTRHKAGSVGVPALPGQRPAMSRQDALAAQREARERTIFNLQVRQLQALESIAESLHVAYEEKVDAFRARMAKPQEAEAQARAKAQAEAVKKAQAGSPAVPGTMPEVSLPPPGDGPATEGVSDAILAEEERLEA